MPERLRQILDKIIEWWKKFTFKQKTLIGSLAAVVVIALVILGFVVSRPTWITLKVCESATEASQIVELLEESNIDYKTTSDGLGISIKEDDEATAHLLLGSNNITTDAYTIDNVFDGSFSTTEADKEKKYKLYLEEKLSSEITETQEAVDDAAVSLSIPDNDGTILSQQEDTYASVILTLNSELTEDQATGIAKYVATAVGDDDTENILLLDSNSNVLFSGADSADTVAGTTASQTALLSKAQANVKSQVSDVLLGSELYDNVKIGLNLSMNFDQESSTTTHYSVDEGRTEGYLDEQTTYKEESQSGSSGVPGTDSNDETTYVIETDDLTYSTVEETSSKYLPDSVVTTVTKQVGKVEPEESSITVVANRYVTYDEDALKASGALDDMTFDEYVAANSDKVQTEVDEELLTAVSNATGIPTENITILSYDVPFFQYSTGGVDFTDYLQFIIAAAILIMLGFVIFRSTRSEEEPEIEPELSVENLLESTKEEESVLEEIGYSEKSETRILIEKFIDENPAAVASLLRNWIEESDEWE